MSIRTTASAAIIFLAMIFPVIASAYSYYTEHNFMPYTYVNTMPYVNVNAASYASASSYSYYPTYSYPQYSQQKSGYQSAPTYVSEYRSNGEYCYSGYGCYPKPVKDPHQWVYDKWTGTWY